MSPTGPTPPTIRRRRAIALTAAVLVLGLAGLAAAVLGGGGAPKPHYVPPGGVARQLPTPRVRLARVTAKPFHPAPAAVAAAARMPLAAQVAQLFVVDVPGKTAGSAGTGTNWGGVVLTRANYASRRQAATLVRQLGAARDPTVPALRPLIAATQTGGSHSAFPGLPPRGQQDVAATNDPGIEQTQALAAGRKLRALGVTMTLAPLADVDVPSRGAHR